MVFGDRGEAMAQEKKSVSLKIDETIEGVLKFLLRYCRTLGRISRFPHRPDSLLYDVEANPPVIVRPLTFLTIGAFLFALLIDVYPRGFAGLVDFIWMTDEIRDNVSKRWKDAISVTTLITAGLPTVVTVSLLAAGAGRLFFRRPADRDAWFDAACYAFGYQTAVIFLIFSLDSLYTGLGIAFPFVSGLKIPEPVQSPLALGVLAAVVAAALFVPLILLAGSLLSLWGPKRLGRTAAIAAALVFWAATQYLYAGIASVLPELNARYFPEAKPKAMIFEEILRDDGGGAPVLVFQLLLENKTDDDVLVELAPHRLEVHLARAPEDKQPLEVWRASGWELARRDTTEDSRRFIAAKKSRSIFAMRARGFDLAAMCKAFAAARKRDAENPQFRGALVNLYLSADVNFRSRSDNARTDRMLEEDALCGNTAQ